MTTFRESLRRRYNQGEMLTPCLADFGIAIMGSVDLSLVQGQQPQGTLFYMVWRCRLTEAVDPGLKVLGFQPVESTSPFKVVVSDMSTCTPTPRQSRR